MDIVVHESGIMDIDGVEDSIVYIVIDESGVVNVIVHVVDYCVVNVVVDESGVVDVLVDVLHHRVVDIAVYILS